MRYYNTTMSSTRRHYHPVVAVVPRPCGCCCRAPWLLRSRPVVVAVTPRSCCCHALRLLLSRPTWLLSSCPVWLSSSSSHPAWLLSHPACCCRLASRGCCRRAPRAVLVAPHVVVVATTVWLPLLSSRRVVITGSRGSLVGWSQLGWFRRPGGGASWARRGRSTGVDAVVGKRGRPVRVTGVVEAVARLEMT
jgi:hypothetical protein